MQINNYKLTIPYAPDSINKVVTYGKKSGDVVVLKHKWQFITNILIDQALANDELPVRFKGKVAFFFKLYFKTERDRDGDNYTLMCKGMVDSFVQKGLISDDNSKMVDDNGRRLIVDAERPRAEIYITEKIPLSKVVTIKPYEQTT